MEKESNRRARRTVIAQDILVILVLLGAGFVIAAVKFVPVILRWIRNS